MALIDYNKASNMAPHSWLRKSMMLGVAQNMPQMLDNNMEKWKTDTTPRVHKFETVIVQIFMSLGSKSVKAGHQLKDLQGKVNHH